MIERDGNELRLSRPGDARQRSGPVRGRQAAVERRYGGRSRRGDRGRLHCIERAVRMAARRARDKNVHVSFRNLPDSMSSLAALYGVAELVAPDA